MKTFFILLVSVLAPLASASAKTVTIEMSDVFSYEDIKAFSDGTVAVTGPKVYEYYIGAETRGVAADNAVAACRQIGKKPFNYEIGDAKAQIRTINYTLNEDGSLSVPWFAYGGKYSTLFIKKVMCK
jgi:hypothetical protein